MAEERFCILDTPRSASCQRIKVIYDVRADGDYRVTRWFYNSVDNIVVLTRRGGGKLWLREDAGEISVGAGDLIVIPADQLKAYAAEKAGWSFIWCEFDSDDLPLSPMTRYRIDSKYWYEEMCGVCLQQMLDQKEELASAMFTAILYLWSDAVGVAQDMENHTLINRSLAYIRENIQTVTVKSVADEFFVSDRTLRNLFSKYVGCSPSEMLRKIRIKEARSMLESSIYTVSEIAERLGYGSPFYFSKIFMSQVGISPTEYRRRANKFRDMLQSGDGRIRETDEIDPLSDDNATFAGGKKREKGQKS